MFGIFYDFYPRLIVVKNLLGSVGIWANQVNVNKT
jgi:hypothetical protein